MKRVLLLTTLVAIGCQKAPTATSPSTPAITTTAPIKKIIESGSPDFAAMLAAFRADPKTTKFAREIVSFKMTVGSVKVVDPQTYLVNGKGDGINLTVTFLLRPNTTLNQQVRQLAQGDTVTYWAEPAEYKPGDPPTVTTLSGSINGVDSPAKSPK